MIPVEYICREIKKSIADIREIDPKDVGEDGFFSVSEKDQMLLRTIEVMVKCSKLAEIEGLLSLEEFICYEMEEFSGYKYLNDMIMLVIDGTDPELIVQMYLFRYCSSRLRAYDALQYFIILVGCLSIQSGERHRVIEQKLIYMLPEELTGEYIRAKDKSDNNDQTPEDGDDDLCADDNEDVRVRHDSLYLSNDEINKLLNGLV